MRIPARVRYAVRILVEIGKNPESPVPLPEVEKTQRISAKFAKQILQPLVEKKFVAAKRGIKGGYYLPKKPSAIRIKDVFETLGEKAKLAPCLEKRGVCDREKAFGARRKWAELQDVMDAFIAKATIQDFIDEERTAKRPKGRQPQPYPGR